MYFCYGKFYNCGSFGLDEPSAVDVFYMAVYIGVFWAIGEGSFAVGQMGVAGPEVQLQSVGDIAAFVVGINIVVPSVFVEGLTMPFVIVDGIDYVVYSLGADGELKGVGDGTSIFIFVCKKINSTFSVCGVMPSVGVHGHDAVGSIGWAAVQSEVVDVVAAEVPVVARGEDVVEGDIVSVTCVRGKVNLDKFHIGATVVYGGERFKGIWVV